MAPAVLLSENLAHTNSGNGASSLRAVNESPDDFQRMMSADGRFVVYYSSATNLTSEPNNGRVNVYVRDRQTNTTELVSVNIGGAAGGGSQPTISGNGRFVAFVAPAINSTFPDGTPNPNAYVPGIQFAPHLGGLGNQVYVRDLQTHTTKLATVYPDGVGSFGNSSHPTISDDGDAVAFEHAGDDLSALDHNNHTDIYIHYFSSNQNVLASHNAAGNNGGNNRSIYSIVAADGKRVAFASDATDLTTLSDTNNQLDLFSYEVATDTVTPVDVNAAGKFPVDSGVQSSGTLSYVVDRSGLRFAFQSPSGDLLPGVGMLGGVFPQLFYRDLATSSGVTLVSRLPNGDPAPQVVGYEYTVSGDGRYVAFASAQAYTNELSPNGNQQIWVFDATTNAYLLASRATNGGPAENASGAPALSGDGRYVLFNSLAGNLVPSFTGPSPFTTLYVRDLLANQTFPVSANAAGTAAVPVSPPGEIAISRSGSAVVFTNNSPDGAYGFPDTNNTTDVFASAVPVISDIGNTVIQNDSVTGQPVLFVTGTAGNDTVLLKLAQNGSRIEVVINGTPRGLFDPAAFVRIDADGLAGNDLIQFDPGIAKDASITGRAGDDTIVAGAGNDTLTGDDGNDQLFGEDGNDLVFGGLGDDSMDGNAGNDSIDGNEGNDLLFGSDGADLLFGSAGVDNMDGGAGNDNMDGGVGDDVMFGSAGSDFLFGNDGNDGMDAGDGNDSLDSGAGNDLMFGLGGNDVLFGLGGNDSMDGGDGDDGMDGGDGDDVMFGSAGNDQCFGSAGNDAIDAGAGNDSVDGNAGNDLLFGSGGDDLLFGSAGKDSIDGNDGNDSIDGGDGDDLLFGSGGNDLMFGSGGVDAMDGGPGVDAGDGGGQADLLFNYP